MKPQAQDHDYSVEGINQYLKGLAKHRRKREQRMGRLKRGKKRPTRAQQNAAIVEWVSRAEDGAVFEVYDPYQPPSIRAYVRECPDDSAQVLIAEVNKVWDSLRGVANHTPTDSLPTLLRYLRSRLLREVYAANPPANRERLKKLVDDAFAFLIEQAEAANATGDP